ncbi:toll/interleukin-1 receptor domain-containing protein [Microtetraspora malaysiensis]|uniref:toll/interleukin-1 receptor domain-containing protein n=1 Tax=Microtetraspora malaysiensis TaxID=161358 RepID=UPI003D911A94
MRDTGDTRQSEAYDEVVTFVLQWDDQRSAAMRGEEVEQSSVDIRKLEMLVERYASRGVRSAFSRLIAADKEWAISFALESQRAGVQLPVKIDPVDGSWIDPNDQAKRASLLTRQLIELIRQEQGLVDVHLVERASISYARGLLINILGIAWALVPAVTYGLGTWAAFAFAAFRQKSRAMAIASVCYAAVPVVFASTAGIRDFPREDWRNELALMIWVVGPWFGGTAHAFLVRKKVFPAPMLVPSHTLAATKSMPQAHSPLMEAKEDGEHELTRLGVASSQQQVHGRDATPSKVNPVSDQITHTVPGHAFISYVREDAERVDRLQEILKSAGIRVWRDTDNLWPGQDWKIEITQAIKADGLAFIACFSTHSVSRERSFQHEELILAVEELRLRRPGKGWLIPVRFDDCELPHYDVGPGRTLGSLQWLDLFDDTWERGADRLVKAVLNILG